MKNILGSLTAVLCCAAAVPILAEQAKGTTQAHVTSADAVTFMPLDPKNPGGFQVAVVSGDLMAKAPVTFLLRFPKGAPGPHSHTAGYHGVVDALGLNVERADDGGATCPKALR